MLNPIEINFKLDKTIKRALTTELMIKSHDINVIEFHISFDGLELTADHTVKVLSVFNDTESQTNVTCDIADGKAIYRPDTSLISQYEYVQNYVYLYHGDQSLDVREFRYSVSLSKIDETALKVKEVYDQSYSDLLENFEQALTDYKDALPQASDLRAEIDVILGQFGVDSQAKLNQFDTDAQQAIADNQTAFDLAESNRQSTYEQAEDSRNQASNQSVVDWEQGADELVDSKLIEMQTNTNTLVNGAIDDFNMRGDTEIADWRTSADVELEEYLSNKVVLENLVVNGNFDNGISDWVISIAISENLESGISFTATQRYGGVSRNIITSEYNGQKLYLFSRVKTESSGATLLHNSNLGFSLIKHSGNGEWQLLSFVHDQPINATRLRPEVRDESLGPFLPIEVEYIGAINLTSIFGAGNEPTKEWMDRLVEQTGYFDEYILDENWQVGEMLRLDETKANKVQEDWIEPVMLNGATLDTREPLRYMKDEFGFIHFKGAINSKMSIPNFVLPSGYRPSNTASKFSLINGSTNLFASAMLNSAGEFHPYQDGVKLYLDNITFKSEV